MGRVQGGARAAFATPSWGPARMTCYLHLNKGFGLFANKIPVVVPAPLLGMLGNPRFDFVCNF